MGSTNKTAHYELPQFVANDKPSWLGDVNEAMEAIDTGIYGAKSSADGAQQTANNAVAGVQSAGTRMDGIQTQLDTVATQANQTATTVAGHTSSIATNSANINTLNSRMGSTDISGIGDGTVTGAISSIAQGGGGGGGASVWTRLQKVTGMTAISLSGVTFQELLIVLTLGADTGATLTMNVPKNILSNTAIGIRNGWSTGSSYGMGRVNVSLDNVTIAQNGCYLNAADTTATSTMEVFYR